MLKSISLERNKKLTNERTKKAGKYNDCEMKENDEGKPKRKSCLCVCV